MRRVGHGIRSGIALLIAAAAPAAADWSPGTWVSADVMRTAGGEWGQALAMSTRLADDGRNQLVAGLSRFDLDTTSWTTFSANFVRRQAQKWLLDVRLEAGPGRIAGDRIVYRKAGAGVTWLPTKRIVITARDTFVNIGDTVGRIHALEASWRPVDRLAVGVTFSDSAGSRIDTRQALLRVDYHGRRHWFAGVADGVSGNPVLFGNTGDVTGRQPLRQAFAGVQQRYERFDLTVSVDYVELGASDRWTLSAALALPFSIGEQR